MAEPEPGAKFESKSGVAAAISGITEIAAKVLDRVPVEQQPKILLTYILAIIAVLTVGFPPYNPAYKGLTIGFLVIALWLVAGGRRRSKQIRKGFLTARATRKVYKEMGKARTRLSAELKSRGLLIPAKYLRANVFVPLDHQDRAGLLGIYPSLTLNMTREPERNLTLTPQQGVTGLVFRTGKAKVAERIDDGSSTKPIWDGVYNITPELAEVIHPNLQWIMSMPLNRGQKTVGVFNIDCVTNRGSYDQINQIMVRSILPRAATIEKVFAKGLR